MSARRPTTSGTAGSTRVTYFCLIAYVLAACVGMPITFRYCSRNAEAAPLPERPLTQWNPDDQTYHVLESEFIKMEEARDLRPNLEATILALKEQVAAQTDQIIRLRDIQTRTASSATRWKASAEWCASQLDRRAWYESTNLNLLIGFAAGAGACIGIAHAVPKGACP